MTLLRAPLKTLAFVLALSSSHAVLASPSELAADQAESVPDKYSQMEDDALLELFQTYSNEQSVSICAIRSLLSEMATRDAFSENAALIHTVASVECAVERRDWKVAYRHMQEWEALETVERPDAEWVFRIAYLAGEQADALNRLDAMAQLEEPDQLLSLSDETIFHMIREFRRDDGESAVTRFYDALVRSPHFPKLQSNIRSAAAAHLLGERLKSGEQNSAGALLAHISSPFLYNELLAEREYEAIWPEIEERVGLNMGKVLEEDLRIQRAAHHADPENKQIKQEYGHALFFAGRFEDVIALAQSIDHGAEAIQTWEEEDGWLLNMEAYAHDALGNTAAADRIFDSFTGLDNPASQNRWLVNFVINRASRLVNQARWEEALSAATIAGRIAEETGSPYARMLVRRAKACALHNLGRREETQAVIAEVETHQADSPSVAVGTLLCVGDRERAAEIMVEGLASEKGRSALIEKLQKPQFDLFYFRSQLPSTYDELRAHPKVALAFDRVARSIPDKFIPLSSQRRDQLALGKQAD